MAYRTQNGQTEEQDEASRLFDEAVGLIDESVEYGQSDRFRSTELCEQAITLLMRVHQLEPEATIVLARIGQAANRGCGNLKNDEDRSSKKTKLRIAKLGIPFVQKLVDIDPGDVFASGTLATLYGVIATNSWLGMTRRKMADKGISVLEKLEKQPAMNEGPKAEVTERWSELHGDMAIAYRVRAEVGKESELIEFLQKSKGHLQAAVERDPNNVVARFNSANSQIGLAKLVKEPEARRQWLEESLAAQLEVIEVAKTADKSLHFFSHDGSWSPDYIEFNLACIYALLGDSEKALKELEFVAKRENISHATIVADSDFDSIRDLPEFKAMTKNA